MAEAKRRGIPSIRLNEDSYVQLGQGKYQRRIVATLMDDTSYLGVTTAGSKAETKRILAEHGIPVPRGRAVSCLDEAVAQAKIIGYPLVLKPLNGNHGRGVTTDIRTEDELRKAYIQACGVNSEAVVEQYLLGFDYRLLVVNHQLVAAAMREPAHVIGDGLSTVRQLIELLNIDSQRGDGHEKALTKVKFNSETELVLDMQGLSLDYMPSVGEKVLVSHGANLSSGGTARGVTAEVHPSIRLLAERVSRLIGLNVVGIDLIAPAIDRPLDPERSGVIEVNASPGFRMHLSPSSGPAVNVAKPVVDMLFPKGTPHSIPICAVTGTNGKTTTTRLIAHLMKTAGFTVGTATTDSVLINDFPVLKGDYSGPTGAQTVLKDPTVDMAVVEVARGGILRRGLGFGRCDVGVLLNVTADHLGLNGIETLSELARVKSTVTETVHRKGWAVFNIDDPEVRKVIERAKARPLFISQNPENPLLDKNLKQGNVNVTVVEGAVVIQKAGESVSILPVLDIPITYHGAAAFNVENVLAAVGAAYSLGASVEVIREGLLSFFPQQEQLAGRMNLMDMGDFTVLVDYGHNAAAITAVTEFLKKFPARRIIRMGAGVGDRRDGDIRKFGEIMGQVGDHFILTDPSPRGRAPGATAEIVKQGILSQGVSEELIEVILNERDAVRAALELAEPGDLVVLQIEDVDRTINDVLEFRSYLAQLPLPKG